MRPLLGLLALASLGCGAGAKERPRPAEEPLVVSQAATKIRQPTVAGASASSPDPSATGAFPQGTTTPAASGKGPTPRTNSGPTPDLGGVVVGTRADTSPPLQGLKAGIVNGKQEGYSVPATKPFMGFPLTENSFVSVDNGKIIDVTNGVAPASCASLLQKLTASYGPARPNFGWDMWKVGTAEIAVMTKGGCTVMTRIAH